MGYRQVMKMIWCEHCSGGPWRRVNGLMWRGEVVVRSGTLKTVAMCHACEERLAPGDRVEAVALNIPESERSEWLGRYVSIHETSDRRATEKRSAA